MRYGIALSTKDTCHVAFLHRQLTRFGNRVIFELTNTDFHRSLWISHNIKSLGLSHMSCAYRKDWRTTKLEWNVWTQHHFTQYRSFSSRVISALTFWCKYRRSLLEVNYHHRDTSLLSLAHDKVTCETALASFHMPPTPPLASTVLPYDVQWICLCQSPLS